MFDACKLFVEERGRVLQDKKLFNNFLLHVQNLYDYGLIDGVQMRDVMVLMRGLENQSTVESSDGSVKTPDSEDSLER